MVRLHIEGPTLEECSRGCMQTCGSYNWPPPGCQVTAQGTTDLKDLCPGVLCWVWKLDLPVEPPGAHEGRVQNICTIGGGNHLRARGCVSRA